MTEQMNNGTTPETAPEVQSAPAAPTGKPESEKEPPKSAPAPKELTPAQMQKRRKMMVYPLFMLVFAAVMWLIFAPSKNDNELTAGQSGFNAELPDPGKDGIVGNKRDAYQQEAMQAKQQEKMQSLQDLAFALGENEETEEQRIAREQRQIRMAPRPPEYYENPELFEGGPSSRSSNALQSSAYAYDDINRQLGSFYEQPSTEADRQERSELEQRIKELENKLDEEAVRKKTEDDQLALMERSYQLAAKYMPQSAVQTTGGQTALPDETGTVAPAAPSGGQSGKVVAQPVRQVRPDVVSLLAAPVSDAEFIRTYSKPRNLGFLTAAGNEGVQDKNSIRACVYQTVTLTNGKELQIRLLEPMRAGNILIPANTVITGACKITGERMDVAIISIQYADNIIPVELTVYDTDGQKGIFVPGNDEINAAKEVASTLANSSGSSIMISDNAGSQLAADMGKGLIQGASQYVSKKMSVVKVTLKANYQLLLLPKTQ